MKKYGVTITYKESRYIEVEAVDAEDAEDVAWQLIDTAEPYGDEDYEFEVEEIETNGTTKT